MKKMGGDCLDWSAQYVEWKHLNSLNLAYLIQNALCRDLHKTHVFHLELKHEPALPAKRRFQVVEYSVVALADLAGTKFEIMDQIEQHRKTVETPQRTAAYGLLLLIIGTTSIIRLYPCMLDLSDKSEPRLGVDYEPVALEECVKILNAGSLSC